MKKGTIVTLAATCLIVLGGSFGGLYYKYTKTVNKLEKVEQIQEKESSTEKVVSDAESKVLQTYFNNYYKEMTTLDKEKIQKFANTYFDKNFLKTANVDGFVKALKETTKTYEAVKVTYTGKIIGATTLNGTYYIALREFVSLDGADKMETGIGIYTLEKSKDTYKISDISMDEDISKEFSNTIEKNGVKMELKEKEKEKE